MTPLYLHLRGVFRKTFFLPTFSIFFQRTFFSLRKTNWIWDISPPPSVRAAAQALLDRGSACFEAEFRCGRGTTAAAAAAARLCRADGYRTHLLSAHITQYTPCDDEDDDDDEDEDEDDDEDNNNNNNNNNKPL
jgi:hypothetical protein